MKNFILAVLFVGGMMFAMTDTAEAGHGNRGVRRSHRSHYTPVYRSYGIRYYSPRSYYYGGSCNTYGSYYGGYNSHIHVNYGHGGWGFSIH